MIFYFYFMKKFKRHNPIIIPDPRNTKINKPRFFSKYPKFKNHKLIINFDSRNIRNKSEQTKQEHFYHKICNNKNNKILIIKNFKIIKKHFNNRRINNGKQLDFS